MKLPAKRLNKKESSSSAICLEGDILEVPNQNSTRNPHTLEYIRHRVE